LRPWEPSARRQARTQVLKCLARACAEEWFAGGGTGTVDELEHLIYRALEKAELEGRLMEQWRQWSAERRGPRLVRSR